MLLIPRWAYVEQAGNEQDEREPDLGGQVSGLCQPRARSLDLAAGVDVAWHQVGPLWG